MEIGGIFFVDFVKMEILNREVAFYDFIKEKTTQLAPMSENSDTDVTAPPVVPSMISIKEMLSNVNDKDGNSYVDKNGNLNYEFGVLKLLQEGKSFYQSAWHGSSYILNKFDLMAGAERLGG